MNIKNMRVRKNFCGYTLSGMDRDSMPDFFIQKRGHLLSPRYTINSPQNHERRLNKCPIMILS